MAVLFPLKHSIHNILIRKASVCAGVSFGWESNVYFHQDGRSFSRNFSSDKKRMLEKFVQCN